jgi:hypothetical protein
MTDIVQIATSNKRKANRIIRWLRARNLLAYYDRTTATTCLHVTKYGREHAEKRLREAWDAAG